MKRITLLIVALVAMLAVATNVAAADWSSSVGKASVSPTDECAKVPNQAKGWSVALKLPKSWSDGSSYKTIRGLLSFGVVPSAVKPSCGNGGQTPCNTWVYIGNGYWMWRPC